MFASTLPPSSIRFDAPKALLPQPMPGLGLGPQRRVMPRTPSKMGRFSPSPREIWYNHPEDALNQSEKRFTQ